MMPYVQNLTINTYVSKCDMIAPLLLHDQTSWQHTKSAVFLPQQQAKYRTRY